MCIIKGLNADGTQTCLDGAIVLFIGAGFTFLVIVMLCIITCRRYTEDESRREEIERIVRELQPEDSRPEEEPLIRENIEEP